MSKKAQEKLLLVLNSSKAACLGYPCLQNGTYEKQLIDLLRLFRYTIGQSNSIFHRTSEVDQEK